MKTITGISILLLLCTAAQAQRNCGADSYTRQLILNNPAVGESISRAEQQIQATIQNNMQFQRRDTSVNELIVIPVAVHVLYKTAEQNISDAQVMSQIDALNKDFSNTNEDAVNRPKAFNKVAADVRIRFELAQVDPTGKKTTGITRKQTVMEVFEANDAMKWNASGGDNGWNCKKYLNIWVCNMGGRTLGYASLPGSPADVDGVVIGYDVFGTVGNVRAPFNKGRTATHEIGHWLGLKHLWGDTDCGDDGVYDTPRQKTYNFGCPSFPHITECSQTENGDMFMNFMDFSDDPCMNMFTEGQKERMRALFAAGNLRNSFLVPSAADSAAPQTTTPAATAADTISAVKTEQVKADAYRVYPNPVQSVLTVEYKPAADMLVKTFAVYNTMGIKVLGGQVSNEKNSFNLSSLSKGIYIVRIGEGKDVFTTKIFRQ